MLYMGHSTLFAIFVGVWASDRDYSLVNRDFGNTHNLE